MNEATGFMRSVFPVREPSPRLWEGLESWEEWKLTIRWCVRLRRDYLPSRVRLCALAVISFASKSRRNRTHHRIVSFHSSHDSRLPTTVDSVRAQETPTA